MQQTAVLLALLHPDLPPHPPPGGDYQELLMLSLLRYRLSGLYRSFKSKQSNNNDSQTSKGVHKHLLIELSSHATATRL